MATTYELIASTTVGSGGASSITFMSTGNIPNTYTDLKILASLRTNRSNINDSLELQLNGSTSNRSSRNISGDGSATASDTTLAVIYAAIDGNTVTSSTFANVEIYIPNYLSSNYKSVSADGVMEANSTQCYSSLNAWLWSDTSQVTSITLKPILGSNFTQYSTAYLYGIKNS